MIICATANFLKQLHSLEDENLTNNYESFAFCKPGLMPLFRTFKTILNFVQSLKSQYIAYEDEFNRISRVINQTQLIIKAIYREFYRKLTLKRVDEINTIYNDIQMNPFYAHSYVLSAKLHLCVGTSFMAAFF
jgi:hypothetical protein